MVLHAASATFHPSPRIMLAALKFFLGQDQVPEGEEDESSDEEEDGDIKAMGPTKAEFYKANKKVQVISRTDSCSGFSKCSSSTQVFWLPNAICPLEFPSPPHVNGMMEPEQLSCTWPSTLSEVTSSWPDMLLVHFQREGIYIDISWSAQL